jgi:hypothetical protein
MSPEALAAIQHIAEFAAALPGEIHPSGREAIRSYLRDAQYALDIGDNTEAARLLRNVNEKAGRNWHGMRSHSSSGPMSWPRFHR